MNEEIWQDIPLYEGEYQASSFGRICSLKNGKTKVLKPGTSYKGYLCVKLSKNRKTKQFFVHTLVFSTFNGPIPPGMTVDHVDNVKTNNRPENLQLLTRAENSSKAHKGRKLSEEHKAKVSAAHKGRKHTEETKAKMSAAQKARQQREKHGNYRA